MALLEIAKTGFNLVKGGINLVTGGGEKGSGQTKTNTLAHAIDKLDKANDIEALEIAPEAAQTFASTGSEQRAASLIARRLGYSGASVLMVSRKWGYISRMLRKEAQEIQTKQNKRNFTQKAAPNIAATQGTANGQSMGILQQPQLLIFGGLVGFLIWALTR